MAQPGKRPVLVITGDGEQLMGLGAPGHHRRHSVPPTSTIAVLDNEHYGETGMQDKPHGARRAPRRRSPRPAASPGPRRSGESAGVEDARRRLTAFDGPGLAVFKVAPTDLARVLPPIDAVYVKHRLRQALGFAPR